jgi:hypothetical protein
MVRLSRAGSWFLVAFGVWTWIIWPTFIKNIAADPRSWTPSGGPSTFFNVHLVLTVVSFVAGTVIGAFGIRGLVAGRRSGRAAEPAKDDTATKDDAAAGAGR